MSTDSGRGKGKRGERAIATARTGVSVGNTATAAAVTRHNHFDAAVVANDSNQNRKSGLWNTFACSVKFPCHTLTTLSSPPLSAQAPYTLLSSPLCTYNYIMAPYNLTLIRLVTLRCSTHSQDVNKYNIYIPTASLIPISPCLLTFLVVNLPSKLLCLINFIV